MAVTKTVRERDIEKFLVTHIKTQGGEVRKLKWIGRRGAPDRAVFLNGLHLVELKRPGGALRPEQRREHKRLHNAGVKVHVLDSYESASLFVNAIVWGTL